MVIQEFTITKVDLKDTDSKGNPLLTKDGKKYKRLGIQIDYADYDGKWLSKLVFGPEDRALQLKVGDRVKLKIEPNGDYLNFDLPTRTDLLEERVGRLERWVSQMNENLMKAKTAKAEGRATPNAEVAVEPPEDEIPF